MSDALPTLFQQPGSRWWYYSWYHAGGRDRLSCRAWDLHTGIPYEEALRRLCIALGITEPGPAPSAETLAWFRDDILHRLERDHARAGTVKEYRIALDHLVSCFGESYPLRNFRRADIGRLQDYLLRTQEPPTVNKTCRHLRGAFSRLVDDEILDRNPFRKFRKIEEHPPVKHLTREETATFLEVLSRHPEESIRRLIRIFLFTGRRQREILWLPRRNCDLATWTMRVPNAKARRRQSQIIFIPPAIRRSVAWFLQEPRRSHSVPVFPPAEYLQSIGCLTPARDHLTRDLPFNICKPGFLTRRVKSLMLSAGLGVFHPDGSEDITKTHLKLHSLRHTFGTLAREFGASREDLQAHFGHADISTTEIYDHYTPLPEIPLGLDFGAENDT